MEIELMFLRSLTAATPRRPTMTSVAAVGAGAAPSASSHVSVSRDVSGGAMLAGTAVSRAYDADDHVRGVEKKRQKQKACVI